MIKIGCCINMNATDHDPTGSWSVKHMRSAGFDYIEAPLAQIHALSLEERLAVYRDFENSQLPVLAMNNFFPANVKLTGPQVERKQIRQYLEHAFSVINELQVETVVLGSSGSKNIPEGFLKEKATTQMQEALLLIADYAEKHQKIIVIEPLNRQESNFIINSMEGWQLVQSVDSDYIKLLIDYYHFALENEPLTAIDFYQDGIYHVHIADKEGRSYLQSKHMDEYRKFIEKLIANNYKRKISIEANTQAFDTESEQSVYLLKKLLNT